MDATLIRSETLATRGEVDSSDRRLRYRIAFADGSVGTRFFDTPLRIGQHVVGAGTSRYVIGSIESEPESGGLGRASAVPVLP